MWKEAAVLSLMYHAAFIWKIGKNHGKHPAWTVRGPIFEAWTLSQFPNRNAITRQRTFPCEAYNCSAGEPEWFIKTTFIPYIELKSTSSRHIYLRRIDLLFSHLTCRVLNGFWLNSSIHFFISLKKKLKFRKLVENIYMCMQNTRYRVDSRLGSVFHSHYFRCRSYYLFSIQRFCETKLCPMGQLWALHWRYETRHFRQTSSPVKEISFHLT